MKDSKLEDSKKTSSRSIHVFFVRNTDNLVCRNGKIVWDLSRMEAHSVAPCFTTVPRLITINASLDLFQLHHRSALPHFPAFSSLPRAPPPSKDNPIPSISPFRLPSMAHSFGSRRPRTLNPHDRRQKSPTNPNPLVWPRSLWQRDKSRRRLVCKVDVWGITAVERIGLCWGVPRFDWPKLSIAEKVREGVRRAFGGRLGLADAVAPHGCQSPGCEEALTPSAGELCAQKRSLPPIANESRVWLHPTRRMMEAGNEGPGVWGDDGRQWAPCEVSEDRLRSWPSWIMMPPIHPDCS